MAEYLKPSVHSAVEAVDLIHGTADLSFEDTPKASWSGRFGISDSRPRELPGDLPHWPGRSTPRTFPPTIGTGAKTDEVPVPLPNPRGALGAPLLCQQ